MKSKKTFQPEELRYLRLLAKQYPTVQAASTEIINLQAILNLPKGTEHFISDIHGEYEAFLHILNSCSGVVKEKLDELFGASLPRAERDQLATLIYYPEEKLELIRRETSFSSVTMIRVSSSRSSSLVAMRPSRSAILAVMRSSSACRSSLVAMRP